MLKQRIISFLQHALKQVIAAETTRRMKNAMRREQLLQLTLHEQSSGIQTNSERGRPIIVSLTTHGERLHEACLAIESIMQGTMKPDGIVLWLDDNDRRPLPITLQRQVERGLQVMRTQDIRSYTKLIPALRAFPQADIVTIDDDIFYPHDFLEALFIAHTTYPQAIIANMVMQMSRDSEGIPLNILDWPYLTEMPSDSSSQDLFFEGFGGVFYPCGCFSEEVFNERVFKDICPTADDVWFNAMARLSHTPIRICQRASYYFIGAVNEACQASALHLINNNDNCNDRQLRAVWQRYNLQGK